MPSKNKIGAEDAKAPMATCGNLSLNQVASTTKIFTKIYMSLIRKTINKRDN